MRTNHSIFFAVPPAPSHGIPLRIAFAQRGFTLVELAIVMFVVALLLGGMLLPLASQQDIRNYGDTQKILVEARDALLGFAMANERLPCPASSTSNGQEAFCTTSSGACTETTSVQTHGRCAYPYNGYFPAATLGFSPTDAQGYLLDGWSGESIHRVRYAVTTTLDTYDFTSPPTSTVGIKGKGMSNLLPDLQICNSGAVVQTADCTSNTNALATDAVAVIYSLGKNAATGGTSADELPNVNVPADRVFVNAPQGPAFDDQMLWLSKSTLFNRMVAAGRLP